MPPQPRSPGIDLVPEVTCPNCWSRFPPEQALYVAGHASLRGDPRLEDPDEPRRFLPTRFQPDGAALDVEGTACRELACPACHLVVPRVLFERRRTIILSSFGRTSAGKSYFLAASSRMSRRTFPRLFGLGYTEPHPPSNRLVQSYENALFNHPDPDFETDIPKTQTAGSLWYQSVRFGEELRLFPRPMFFQIAPLGEHPRGDEPQRYARTICLYDNSGESFEPGQDLPNNPVIQHMARSEGLFFVFDPLQEPAFLRKCAEYGRDPQLDWFQSATLRDIRDPQHVVVATVDQCIKKHLGHEIARPLDTPLVVVVAKFDAWSHLFGEPLPDLDVPPGPGGIKVHGLRTSVVAQVSTQLRALMLEFAPEIVAATERLSRHVTYIPVSATGCSPRHRGNDAEGRPILKFLVGDLSPFWVEVPLLWMLSRLDRDLVPLEPAAP
jgi:hypothetical protein